MAPSATYHDPLICDECGCFFSRHDDLCSAWSEPVEPIDVDAPCGYVLTDAGRALLVDFDFDEKFWPASEPFDWPGCPICACPINVCHRDGCCGLKW